MYAVSYDDVYGVQCIMYAEIFNVWCIVDGVRYIMNAVRLDGGYSVQ